MGRHHRNKDTLQLLRGEQKTRKGPPQAVLGNEQWHLVNNWECNADGSIHWLAWCGAAGTVEADWTAPAAPFPEHNHSGRLCALCTKWKGWSLS